MRDIRLYRGKNTRKDRRLTFSARGHEAAKGFLLDIWRATRKPGTACRAPNAPIADLCSVFL